MAYGVKVKNIIEMQSGKKNEKEDNYQKQECLVTKDMVSEKSRKIPNWKFPGRDGV